jgi:hypothetical protein
MATVPQSGLPEIHKLPDTEPLPVREFGWFKAQELVAQWLLGHGVLARYAGYHAPFDLVTENGLRIEVKHANLLSKRTGPCWQFNISPQQDGGTQR